MSTPLNRHHIALAHGSTAGGLPTELLEQASSRLGLVSLLYAATYGAAFYSGQVMSMLGRDMPMLPERVEQVVAAVSIGASLLIFAATRTLRIDPERIIDFGLFYEVVSGLGIVTAEIWNVDFAPQFDAMGAGIKPWFGISWVCVWMLIFPIIVPSTPGKTLLASLATASTAPLAMIMSIAFGETGTVPLQVWVGLAIAVYGSAMIAWVTSRYIYGLGRDIKQAREMGSYRLVELLGRGGMGEVWRAEHRMLARPAAIKLIRSESLQPGAGAAAVRRRFEREAAATAMLRSPHTVQLYDFGVADDGRFYYVMELLDGLDLETFVARFGPTPPARAVAWLLQACASLDEAHGRGLVHRDVKPANIYTCRLGGEVDWIKVLDFGLVKRAAIGEDATRLTAEGVTAGTPGYMAPEMAGGISDVDHRADIYALGCVAFWLLTGTQVFEGDNPVRIIVDHVRTPPVPPSQRCELPIVAELDETILWCLEKDPEDRPQSAAALADRLAGIVLQPGWSAAEARSWWQAHLPVSEAWQAEPAAAPSAEPTS
ncbi:MAG: serine/threonine-protein kinase [Acidobacteriota bacterium]|jgi:serine/threonine-protein kinase